MAVREQAAGGVVFRPTERGWELLLILDRFGCWTLPKGKVEPDESPAQTALREIEEETGIAGRVRDLLGTVCYRHGEALGGEAIKEVTYFLVEALPGEARPQPGEVTDLCWCHGETALERCDYPNNRPIVSRAIAWLTDRRDR
jgi:diadenosine hexaphosphate hydrolase (ATP-forming)